MSQARYPPISACPGPSRGRQVASGFVEALGVKLPAMTLMNLPELWTNLQSERKSP